MDDVWWRNWRSRGTFCSYTLFYFFLFYFLSWQLLTDLMLSVLSLWMFLTDTAYGLYVTFSYCVTQGFGCLYLKSRWIKMLFSVCMGAKARCSAVSHSDISFIRLLLQNPVIRTRLYERSSICKTSPADTLVHRLTLPLMVIGETYYVRFCKWNYYLIFSSESLCSTLLLWGVEVLP